MTKHTDEYNAKIKQKFSMGYTQIIVGAGLTLSLEAYKHASIMSTNTYHLAELCTSSVIALGVYNMYRFLTAPRLQPARVRTRK